MAGRKAFHFPACPNHWRNILETVGGDDWQESCACGEAPLEERVAYVLELQASTSEVDRAEGRLQGMGMFAEVARAWLHAKEALAAKVAPRRMPQSSRARPPRPR